MINDLNTGKFPQSSHHDLFKRIMRWANGYNLPCYPTNQPTTKQS